MPSCRCGLPLVVFTATRALGPVTRCLHCDRGCTRGAGCEPCARSGRRG